MMQHPVFKLQQVTATSIGKLDDDARFLIRRIRAIQPGREGVEESLDRRAFQDILHRRDIEAHFCRAVAQFVRGRQIDVPPGPGLSLVTQLIVGHGQKRPGLMLFRLCENQVV